MTSEDEIQRICSAAVTDLAIKLSFVTAAMTLEPELLRATYNDIESDTLRDFSSKHPEAINELKRNLDKAKSGVFDFNRIYFEAKNNGPGS